MKGLNLISKKDLLARTGISYGQLYRWKRQRLIPDEWFVKQSSYTGQETFFPREQVLSRIQSILELKDTHSMEELAKLFSPELSGGTMTAENALGAEEIDARLVRVLRDDYNKESYEFYEVVLLAVVTQAMKKVGIPPEKAAKLFMRGDTVMEEKKFSGMICIVFVSGKKYRIAFAQGSVLFDESVEVIGKWPLDDMAGKIKIKYQDIWK